MISEEEVAILREEAQTGLRAERELSLTKSVLEKIRKEAVERVIYGDPDKGHSVLGRDNQIAVVQVIDQMLADMSVLVKDGEAARERLKTFGY